MIDVEALRMYLHDLGGGMVRCYCDEFPEISETGPEETALAECRRRLRELAERTSPEELARRKCIRAHAWDYMPTWTHHMELPWVRRIFLTAACIALSENREEATLDDCRRARTTQFTTEQIRGFLGDRKAISMSAAVSKAHFHAMAAIIKRIEVELTEADFFASADTLLHDPEAPVTEAGAIPGTPYLGDTQGYSLEFYPELRD